MRLAGVNYRMSDSDLVVKFTPASIRDMIDNNGYGDIKATPFVRTTILDKNLIASAKPHEVVSCPHLRLNNFILFDGKPISEFAQDPNWKPVPKPLRSHPQYMQLLEQRFSHSPEYDEARAALKTMRSDCPDDILAAYKKGWIVEAAVLKRQPRITMEFKKGLTAYKAVREHVSWTLRYAEEPSDFATEVCQLYDSYDKALEVANVLCADWMDSMLRTAGKDWREDIEWALERVPDKYKMNARLALDLCQPIPGAVIRVCNNKIYRRERQGYEWSVIFEWEDE